MALLRFGGTGNGRDADIDKIGKASDAFWSGKGGKPTHPADGELCRKIIGMHLKRMADELKPDEVKAEVEKIIDASFSGL
jgi:hypothetical protein